MRNDNIYLCIDTAVVDRGCSGSRGLPTSYIAASRPEAAERQSERDGFEKTHNARRRFPRAHIAASSQASYYWLFGVTGIKVPTCGRIFVVSLLFVCVYILLFVCLYLITFVQFILIVCLHSFVCILLFVFLCLHSCVYILLFAFFCLHSFVCILLLVCLFVCLFVCILFVYILFV